MKTQPSLSELCSEPKGRVPQAQVKRRKTDQTKFLQLPPKAEVIEIDADAEFNEDQSERKSRKEKGNKRKRLESNQEGKDSQKTGHEEEEVWCAWTRTDLCTLQLFKLVRIHAKGKHPGCYLVEWEGYSGAARFSEVRESDLSTDLVADFRSRFDWPLRVGEQIEVERKGKKASKHKVVWIGGLAEIRKIPDSVPPIKLDPELTLSWAAPIRRAGKAKTKRAFRPVSLWELMVI